MERIGFKTTSWEEAARIERAADRALTPDERRSVLLALKRRAFGDDRDWVDVRESRHAELRSDTSSK